MEGVSHTNLTAQVRKVIDDLANQIASSQHQKFPLWISVTTAAAAVHALVILDYAGPSHEVAGGERRSGAQVTELSDQILWNSQQPEKIIRGDSKFNFYRKENCLMEYKHFYRTTDPRLPTVHVQVESNQHVQDLRKRHICIQHGDLAKAGAIYMKTSPMPDRLLGRVFVPAKDQSQSTVFYGNALVFCFETDHEMLAFCEESGAIEGTFYEQIPA
jgi:hypothetical protein